MVFTFSELGLMTYLTPSLYRIPSQTSLRMTPQVKFDKMSDCFFNFQPARVYCLSPVHRNVACIICNLLIACLYPPT